MTQPGTSAQVVGQHEAPIKTIKCLQLNGNNVVVTGSWDKTLKIWDCRSAAPVAQAQFNERVFAMDAKRSVIVAGTADRQIHVFDLTSGLNKVAEFKAPMHNYQTKSISIFADGAGFAVGSIEGRVGIEMFSEMSKKSKCHLAIYRYICICMWIYMFRCLFYFNM